MRHAFSSGGYPAVFAVGKEQFCNVIFFISFKTAGLHVEQIITDSVTWMTSRTCMLQYYLKTWSAVFVGEVTTCMYFI